MQKTYLEISARRTGKTTRLVQAAQQHLLTGDVFVLSHSMEHTHELARRIKQVNDAPENMNIVPNRVYTLRSTRELFDPSYMGSYSPKFRGVDLYNPRLFVDEVDAVPYGDEVDFIEGSYYVGTRKQNGCLGRIIDKVGGYEHYTLETTDVIKYKTWPPGGFMRQKLLSPEPITRVVHSTVKLYK